MYILGISAFYHDSAACLIRDGVIVAAAQEERFTRKKHDHRFPKLALDYCLRAEGISGDELDHVVFYDKPWLKFERLLETYLAFAPSGLPSFLKAMPLWLKQKLWMSDLIQKETGFSGEILFPEHHQSHGASAFFPSAFKSAAILTLDGVGEWATASWGQGVDHQIELKGELRFPHSLGLLYSALTYYTGFRVNSGEYKVMGLAPYGHAKYKRDLLEKVVDLKEDGSFRLDMSYFNYCQGLTMTSEKFHDLFGGPPRQPETAVTQKEMDLARSVQEVTEEIMVKMARHVRKMTGERYCCLAGGVALNCVANGIILRENIFDDIWIQPAAGDAGGALGAALFVWHHVLGNPRTTSGKCDSQFGSYLGPAFDGREIESSLQEMKAPFHRKEPDEIAQVGASLLAEGKVLGWFAGRMEFGPRALGARSILGDARSTEMQSVMNLKIKYRESFRPFAPACLVEDVGDFFELDRASPYMLLVAKVRADRCLELSQTESQLFGIDRLNVPRSDIPAVTHVDYSARVQTVDREHNRAFHDLISAFKQQTGYGVVVNTSFNVRGEPIVCTPEDAYLCFMRTEMDALIIENYLLLKEEQPAIEELGDWRDLYALD
jgi:carbamoyltransferase